MTKVMLGWMNEEHGTVETSPSELVYAGADPAYTRELVEMQRRWHDRPGIMHILTDAELVRSLPYRMQGHLWGGLRGSHNRSHPGSAGV